jgi:hypothetical protein
MSAFLPFEVHIREPRADSLCKSRLIPRFWFVLLNNKRKGSENAFLEDWRWRELCCSARCVVLLLL